MAEWQCVSRKQKNAHGNATNGTAKLATRWGKLQSRRQILPTVSRADAAEYFYGRPIGEPDDISAGPLWVA